jgi:serine/threonine protein kinase
MSNDSVARSDLGNMDLVAEGGQGKIFKLTHFRLPDCPGGIAYKEYKPEANFAAAGLRAIVTVRSKMSDSDRATLDRCSVWPSRIVTGNGSNVVGLLMPLIPDEYRHQGKSLVGGSKKKSSGSFMKEREVQYLFIDPSRSERLGFPLVNLKQRLQICLELAKALSFLASQNIVFGDISSKNALYRIGSDPNDIGVMLVDCDAVRVAGTAAAVSQLNSPDWDPPAKERSVLTHATDVYKFGLFIIRSLSPSANASLTRDPQRVAPILDQPGMALLQRSLQDAPANRPKMSEWANYLESFIQRMPAVRVASGALTTTSAQKTQPKRHVARPTTPNGPVPTAGGAKPKAGWKKVNGKWERA